LTFVFNNRIFNLHYEIENNIMFESIQPTHIKAGKINCATFRCGMSSVVHCGSMRHLIEQNPQTILTAYTGSFEGSIT